MKIPPEFLGQARLFRQQVAAADGRVQAAALAIAAPLRRRLAEKPRLRPQQAIDATRAWCEQVSDDFTLDTRVTAARCSLRIDELRVTAHSTFVKTWADAANQPGISLVWASLIAEPGRFSFEIIPVVTLLQHGLARRIERGNGRSVADVLRDLKALVAAALAGDAVEVPVPAGRWVGERIIAHDVARGCNVPILHCQTFLN